MISLPLLAYPDGQVDPYVVPEIATQTDIRRPLPPTYVPDADPTGGARSIESPRSTPADGKAVLDPHIIVTRAQEPTPTWLAPETSSDGGAQQLPTVTTIGQKVKKVPKLAIVAGVLVVIAILAYLRSRRART